MNTHEERKEKVAQLHKSLLDYTSMLVDRVEGLEIEDKVFRDEISSYVDENNKLRRDMGCMNQKFDKEHSKFVVTSFSLGVSLIVNWLLILFYVI